MSYPIDYEAIRRRILWAQSNPRPAYEEVAREKHNPTPARDAEIDREELLFLHGSLANAYSNLRTRFNSAMNRTLCVYCGEVMPLGHKSIEHIKACAKRPANEGESLYMQAFKMRHEAWEAILELDDVARLLGLPAQDDPTVAQHGLPVGENLALRLSKHLCALEDELAKAREEIAKLTTDRDSLRGLLRETSGQPRSKP